MSRRATPNEIVSVLRHLSEEEVIAMDRAGICFIMGDDEQTFVIDNMEKVQSITMEKLLREL